MFVKCLCVLEEPSVNAKLPKVRSKGSGPFVGETLVVNASDPLSLTLDDVLQVVSDQGKQIGELTQAVKELATQKAIPRTISNTKPLTQVKFTDNGKPICLKCQKRGHFAMNCPQR